MSVTEDGGGEQHRKRHSNALLTFETVSAMDQKLVRLIAQFEAFSDAMRRRDQESDDVEARLRGLESRVTVAETASGTSKGAWTTVWLGLIAVATLLVSLTSTIAYIMRGSPH